MKVGVGYCHGTFGELVQGVINEGEPFLIPLPIQLYSKAIFSPHKNAKKIQVYQRKFKAKKACQLLLNKFQIKYGGTLLVHSKIPSGKGMASSTADIIASLRAVANSFSLPLNEELISEIATKIEPTDGIMYDEIVAYDYINGRLIETFGTLPGLLLFGIDIGGSIDTIHFNRRAKNYTYEDKVLFKKAYNLVKKGFFENNISNILAACTISAKINQRLLPKLYFSEMEQIANRYNGGLIVAHSGTVMGILLNPNTPLKKAEIKKAIFEKTGKRSFFVKVLPL